MHWRSIAKAVVMVASAAVCLASCSQSDGTVASCDETMELVRELPPELTSAGDVVAVGSGDTWLLPPSEGNKWSQDVRWDGNTYFLKLGIRTLASLPPSIEVREIGGAHANGKAEVFPTSTGLPGPLPTRITFPHPGCWDITVIGVSGRAHGRIAFDASARNRR